MPEKLGGRNPRERGRKWIALVFLSTSFVLGQTGPRNLDFGKWDDKGVPEEWQVWNFHGNDSDWVQLRHEGCRKLASCLNVESHLSQTFPAAPFAGRAVRITGWCKSKEPYDHADISLTSLTTQKKPQYSGRTPSQTVNGWQYVERTLFVDPEDLWVEIGLEGRGIFEELTFEVLPGFDGPPPEAVQDLYHSLDSWISSGQYGQIPSILFREPTPGRPFDTRTGLKTLTASEITLQSRTQIVSIEAARVDLIRVQARCELKRTSKDLSYQYLLDYRDLWIRGPDGWKLFDQPPWKVQDGRPVGPQSYASLKPTPDLPGMCGLKPGPALDLQLGPTDFQSSLLPAGELKALMLFVDFPDAIHDENSDQVYNTLVRESVGAVAQLSNGVASLKVETDSKWRRLPSSSLEYGFPNCGYFGPREIRYVSDAVAAAKNDGVDVTKYSLYYVVSTRKAWLATCSIPDVTDKMIHTGESGQSAHVAVFTSREHRGLALFHETAHLFGLPDLYVLGDPSRTGGLGDWDLMAELDFPLLTGWNRAKLGWIRPEQIQCVEDGVHTFTLTPLAERDGLKVIAIPVAPSRAYVVELRELVGVDVNVPDEALLVYTVDASIGTGAQPMSLVAKLHRTDAKPYFEEGEVKIELMQASLGSYTVRISQKAVPH